MPVMVVFQTGSFRFALERSSIRDVGSLTTGANGLPGRLLRQMITVKGQSIELIDLAAALDPDDCAAHSATVRLIFISGLPRLALRVDHIRGSISVDAARMSAMPPVFTGRARVCFPKVLHLEQQLVPVLDTTALTVLGQKARPEMDLEQIQHTHAGVAEKAPPNPRPLDGHDLEALVVSKLQEIIAQRAERIVGQTIAETLERRRGHWAMRRVSLPGRPRSMDLNG